MNESLPIERIHQKIYLFRSQSVILDSDLATFYGVRTGALVQAVKRNLERFPSDFMFRLSDQEVSTLMSQIVTSKSRGGRRRSNPYAFTEHGVAMISSVLKSKTAVLVNIQIIRSFIKLRAYLRSHETLTRRIETLERTSDQQAQAIISIIRELEKSPEPTKKHKLGF